VCLAYFHVEQYSTDFVRVYVSAKLGTNTAHVVTYGAVF